MAAGAQSNKNQKNSLADRKQRAAGRSPEREKPPVKGAFGKEGRPNRRASAYPGQGSGGGGGTVSKADYTGVGSSRRKARKRK